MRKKIFAAVILLVSALYGEFSVSGTSGEEVVTDTKTNLVWTKYYWEKTWKDALAHCESLEYGGADDWKLPNVNELQTLINYSKIAPASDFPDMPSQWFWSSSTYSYNTGLAWHVFFSYGFVRLSSKTYTDYVRCLR